MKKLVFALTVLCAALAHASLGLPVIFVGRIVDYCYRAYDKDKPATIKVYAADGTLLKTAKTDFSKEGSLYNYRFELTISDESAATKAGCVHLNEKLKLEVTCTDVDTFMNTLYYTNTVETMATSAIDSVKNDVMLGFTTNKYNKKVADKYIDDNEYYLIFDTGILEDLADYDPDADYDKDGVSNYDEYLAGTQPWDAEDSFIVKEMAVSNSTGYVALKFYTQVGRAYSIESATSLGDDAIWTQQKFTEDISTEPSTEYINNGYGLSDSMDHTVYVKKDGAVRLYRIRVQ